MTRCISFTKSWRNKISYSTNENFIFQSPWALSSLYDVKFPWLKLTINENNRIDCKQIMDFFPNSKPRLAAANSLLLRPNLRRLQSLLHQKIVSTSQSHKAWSCTKALLRQVLNYKWYACYAINSFGEILNGFFFNFRIMHTARCASWQFPEMLGSTAQVNGEYGEWDRGESLLGYVNIVRRRLIVTAGVL